MKMSNYPAASELTDADKILVSRDGVTENVSPGVLAEEVKKRVQSDFLGGRTGFKYRSLIPLEEIDDLNKIMFEYHGMVSSAYKNIPPNAAGAIFLDVYVDESNNILWQRAFNWVTRLHYVRDYNSTYGWNSWTTLLTQDMVSNPNLVINPDGMVNQRGQNSYKGANLNIFDMWETGIGCANLTVDHLSDGTPRIYSTASASGEQNVFTDIDVSKYKNKKLTLSCRYEVNNGPCHIHFGVYDSAGSMLEDKLGRKVIACSVGQRITGEYVYTYEIPSNVTRFRIVFGTEASGGTSEKPVIMQWFNLKLELGSIATAYTPPDPAMELEKCQQYFKRIYPRFLIPSFFRKSTKELSFELTGGEKRNVSVSVNGKLLANAASTETGFLLLNRVQSDAQNSDLLEMTSIKAYVDAVHSTGITVVVKNPPENIMDYYIYGINYPYIDFNYSD